MTPHRDTRKSADKNGSVTAGAFVIDRRFRHVGRIKRSSGTLHLRTFRRVNEMLTTLHEMGRLDLLRAIRDGHLSPLAVWDAFRVGELERLPSAEMVGKLAAALDTFVETVKAGERHRASLKSSVKHLKHAAGDVATIADLPWALKKLREILSEHPRAFNLARSAAQTFARERAGRRSRLWVDVSNVAMLEEIGRQRGHPVMPKELAAFCEKLAPNEAEMAWTMATTGMGPAEYWERLGGSWSDEGSHVRVRGTKREGRDRSVPRMRAPTRPVCWEGKFRELLSEASNGALQPYDLRRTYAHWMELARIPRTRRRLYLGHGKRDVTDLYEWHEVQTFLADDGATLRTWLAEQLAAKDSKVIPFGRAAGDSQ